MLLTEKKKSVEGEQECTFWETDAGYEFVTDAVHWNHLYSETRVKVDQSHTKYARQEIWSGSSHPPFLGFLFAATLLAVVLVFAAQCLRVAEAPTERTHKHLLTQPTSWVTPFLPLTFTLRSNGVPETVSDGGVLLHVHRQIQEVLVFTAHLQHGRERSRSLRCSSTQNVFAAVSLIEMRVGFPY